MTDWTDLTGLADWTAALTDRTNLTETARPTGPLKLVNSVNIDLVNLGERVNVFLPGPRNGSGPRHGRRPNPAARATRTALTARADASAAPGELPPPAAGLPLLGVSAADLGEAVRGGAVEGGEAVGGGAVASVGGVRGAAVVPGGFVVAGLRWFGGCAFGGLRGGAAAAVSSHAGQLPVSAVDVEVSSSRKAAATASGYSIIATWPASGRETRRAARKVRAALGAMR